ncbi:hypothetical protein [Vibrio parahaemolyticus]|uniref:hypothetical protein n=1 Tax=Vibrio parahaemolyticus TaxID=670 RepID=UPI00111DDC99|nr:hypothetical protein [Vibrio parahaemolyticus]TOE29488.1 hypothetical protein CGJ46_23575 [Vibrio parahaemolyticus]
MSLITPEFIQENTLMFSFLLTLSLLGFSIRFVKSLIAFYEDVVIKRYFNRLNSLADNLPESNQTTEYLSHLKCNEVFRLASGIKCSPDKSSMIMSLYILGVADNQQLRKIQRFMKPEGDKVHIETKWFDKLQIAYSLCASLYILGVGLAFGGSHFVFGNGSEVTAGLIIMTMMTLVATVVGTDFRTYRALKRVRGKLIKLELVTNPNSNLMWSAPWKKS